MGCEREDHDSKACPSASGRIKIQLIEVGKAAADLEGKSVFFYIYVMFEVAVSHLSRYIEWAVGFQDLRRDWL